jgi:nucleotide-binding universal stress UspA family protein
MKKILLIYDGSEASDRALDEAVVIARRFGAHVTVASIMPELCFLGVPVDCSTVRDIFRAGTEGLLKRVKSLLYGMHVEGETMVLDGDVVQAVVNHARIHEVDMIVVSDSGIHNGRKLLSGSMVCRIVSSAGCSVLVTK